MNDMEGLKTGGDKPKSWRKSTTIDGVTKSIDVCEIQFKNDKGKLVPAFLVEYCKYGDVDGKYESTPPKKICMLENPLTEDDEAKENESEKIKEDFKGWFDSPMMEV